MKHFLWTLTMLRKVRIYAKRILGLVHFKSVLQEGPEINTKNYYRGISKN